MTVRCSECGAEYDDGTLFCDQDGTELSQPEVGVSATEDQSVQAAPAEEDEMAITPPPEEPVSLPSEAKLIVTRGAQLGVEYPLVAGENEIGRWDDEEGYSPHIDLDAHDMDGYVHRRHALIRYDGSQWWLEHLQEPPANPTRIRGRGDQLEVGQSVPLQDGDEIVIGRVIMKFEVD